ncbi:MAG TPA: GntR family transcriptional regulator [Kineosporiaceae bacterium]|nr:GntR family transcriptional regulator [Kineosporiaceae bacterium]
MTDPTPRAKRASTTRTRRQDGQTTPAASEPGVDLSRLAAQIPDTPPDRAAATLLRRLPVYQQIAEDLRARITSGELPPGSKLPSESQMIDHYGVSRITVRHAVAALRAAGLVDTSHGRATLVRATPGTDQAAPFNTTITHTGHTWATWDSGWDEAEPPARYRTHAGTDAPTLGLNPTEPVFVAERLLQHPNGALAAHQLIVPFTTVTDVPALQADPFTRPADLYAALTDAGHTLRWDDTLRATMPTPDDTATLHIPDGVPLLTHTRTTHNTHGQPLALEHTRLPAHRITITATQTNSAGRTSRTR